MRHRVQVNVSRNVIQGRLLQEQRWLKPSLKQMSPPPVRPVKTACVAHLQPPDRLAQISLSATKQQVVMVVH